MKREQKETAEQYLERIPSFAKKKKERDGGCEGISGASWKPGQGNEDLPCGRDQRKGLCVCLSVLGLKRGWALLRSLYLAPSFGYPGTVSDPGGDGLTGGF